MDPRGGERIRPWDVTRRGENAGPRSVRTRTHRHLHRLALAVDCPDARDQLLEYQHGRLAPDLVAALRRHLDECPDCARAELADRELTRILERRTPQYAAPIALKRKLAAVWPVPGRARARTRWTRVLFPAGLAVAALLLGGQRNRATSLDELDRSKNSKVHRPADCRVSRTVWTELAKPSLNRSLPTSSSLFEPERSYE